MRFGILLFVMWSAAWIATAPAGVTPEQFQSDIQRIKPLLPAGEKLARSWLIKPDTPQNEIIQTLASSYAFGDLNKDGRLDLVMVTEKPPVVVKGDPDNRLEHSKRHLLVFLADKAGALKLFSSNEKIIPAADEGGVNGDPFGSVSIEKNGIIEISLEGGSGRSNWVQGYRIQFRKDDLYLIATSNSSSSAAKNKLTVTNRNLVTGETVITTSKDVIADVEDDSVEIVRKHRKPQPLVRLKNMVE